MIRSRFTRLVLTILLGCGMLTLAPAPAAVAAGCAAPKGVYTGSTPWAQQQLELSSVATLSTGAGQAIAVVGTGIDPANAQFKPGQISTPIDLLAAGGPADCDGRGTFAAGVIGAQPDPRTTVVGVAPGATLIPIRYTQSEDSSSTATPDQLAGAISAAVSSPARIILVAVPVTGTSPALKAAVAAAMTAGKVVVSAAAAGKDGESTYPTAYSGTPGFADVVAVAGVSAAGTPVTVESGPYVSVSAPGSGLVGLAAGAQGKLGHIWPTNDPVYSAAYVAGVIADVAAYRPSLSLHQVVERVLATAGNSNGTRDDRIGWGLVDPVRALTAELPASVTPQSMAGSAAHAGTVVPARPVPPSSPPGRTTGLITIGGLALALLVALVALTVRRGNRRGWRVSRVAS